MEFKYKILKAEPRHKLLHVAYYAEGRDEFHKAFNPNDWSEENILNLINEFSLKRIELMRRLSKRGYNLDRKAFLRLTYDPVFDTFLNNEIKEEDLKDCIKGLFPSPYSSLSLEEYVAIIFEEYFDNPEVAREYSKEICNNIEKVMVDYYDSKF